MRESKIERALRSGLQNLGFKMYKINPTGQKGAPDNIVALYYPDTDFIETKRPKGSTSIHQDFEHTDLKALGHTVIIINTMERVNDYLAAVKRYKSHRN